LWDLSPAKKLNAKEGITLPDSSIYKTIEGGGQKFKPLKTLSPLLPSHKDIITTNPISQLKIPTCLPLVCHGSNTQICSLPSTHIQYKRRSKDKILNTNRTDLSKTCLSVLNKSDGSHTTIYRSTYQAEPSKLSYKVNLTYNEEIKRKEDSIMNFKRINLNLSKQNNNQNTQDLLTLGKRISLRKEKQRSEPKVTFDHEKVHITVWNARSLNSALKVREILKTKPDIILLQEIWDPSQATLDLLPFEQKIIRRGDEHGGTAMLWKEGRLQLCGDPYKINEDSIIIKIILGGNCTIWLCSIYIPKKSKKLLLNVFGKVKQIVPSSEWNQLLIAGDWNVNCQDKLDKVTQLLDILLKQMGLTLYQTKNTRGEKSLDFIVAGNQIRVSDTCKRHSILSNHSSLSKPRMSKASTKQTTLYP